jgi:hypothetical protein
MVNVSRLTRIEGGLLDGRSAGQKFFMVTRETNSADFLAFPPAKNALSGESGIPGTAEAAGKNDAEEMVR